MYSSDERTFAMLAHGSILLNLVTGFGGVIVALIIWLLKKDQYPWVGFQALQALIFQIACITVLPLLLTVSAILIILLVGLILLPVVLLLGLAALVYGLFGAYRCYDGVDFRYPWLGDFLASRASGR